MHRTFIVFIILLATSGATIAQEKKGREICVVRNLPDLLKQEAIKLENGITVRLGIEATECPRWSGVLVYAYTEGFDDIQKKKISSDTLGPVKLTISLNGESFEAKETMDWTPRWQANYNRNKHLLFCRSIGVHKHGEYHIYVKTEKGELVAEVTLRATDSFFHPWMPFLLRADTVRDFDPKESKFRRVKLARAENLEQGIAHPGSSGDLALRLVDTIPEPFFFESPTYPNLMVTKKSLEKSLPKCIPADISEDFRLEFDPQKQFMRIVPSKKIMTGRPDLHFLCRWWVNDKPFVPKYTEKILCELNSITIAQDDDVSLHFALDAKKLGAKSGDSVDLQMLYCPCGWVVAHPTATSVSGSGFPAVTNRIHFKVP